jgi:hypothetical protein
MDSRPMETTLAGFPTVFLQSQQRTGSKKNAAKKRKRLKPCYKIKKQRDMGRGKIA